MGGSESGGVNQNPAGNPQDSSECSQHATDFWCPFCESQITHECGYDHAHAHMDKFPYAVDGDRFYRNQRSGAGE